MKNFIIHFLAVLGAVFLSLILLATYFFVTDPYNLRPLLFGTSEGEKGVVESMVSESSGDSDTATPSIQLNERQKEAVMAVGIDPAVISQTLTSEQEKCFIEIFGESRVEEIKAGDVPSALEFARARGCI